MTVRVLYRGGMDKRSSLLFLLSVLLLVACDNEPGPEPEGKTCTGVPRSPAIATCATGQPSPQQCLELTGPFWTAATAQAACTEDFSTTTLTCPTDAVVGRCLRNCGRDDETLESFYSNGPTTFTAAIAEAVCKAYVGSDAVAPRFLP